MDIVGSRLSREEFESYVNRKFFGYLPADKLVLHHTWKPTVNDWKGYQTLMGIKNYYESLGWKSGPHVFIAPDGIWLMTDMRNNGTHAGSLNWRSIGIEVVGNYDNKTWEGEIYKNAIWAITTLKKKLNIDNEQIHYHSEVSNKTCPGAAIT
ncbi:N-acetylmuramoyl-L-alanine amidase, partial [Patescibacteria group bacterium]|nr:N-acetylmuramoyl-L-alanine amidase [Patescibacteria group bacterium]